MLDGGPLWYPLMFVVFAVVLGLAIGISMFAADDTPEPIVDACQEQLGSDWELRGWIDVSDSDHWHIQCTTGRQPFHETRWIEVLR